MRISSPSVGANIRIQNRAHIIVINGITSQGMLKNLRPTKISMGITIVTTISSDLPENGNPLKIELRDNGMIKAMNNKARLIVIQKALFRLEV
jgi:hypothetical protein